MVGSRTEAIDMRTTFCKAFKVWILCERSEGSRVLGESSPAS